MVINELFFKIFLVNSLNKPITFLGSAFPITSDGGLLTCRHVVDDDISTSKGQAIAVFDPSVPGYIRIIKKPLFSENPNVDMAYLPNVLKQKKPVFFPILTPNKLLIGEDVHSFGYFTIGGGINNIEQGYFGGKLTNILTVHLFKIRNKQCIVNQLKLE